MPVTLTIRDESTGGKVFQEFPLEFPAGRITVRELIRERVYREVHDYNLRRSTGTDEFRGLVQPTDTENTLNGFRVRNHRHIDWQQQFDRAIDAFTRNGFVLMIGNRQAETLDEEIVIEPGTYVSFVKLMPLVGG